MVIWECQLKTSVRESTLEDLTLILEKTYLDIQKQKIKGGNKYIQKEAPLTIAAEDGEPYGRRRNQ